MKKFNKVLAVILSLIMLLTVVPVAAFASENGSTNGGGSSADPFDTLYPAAPALRGNGADGTLTLNLDADALVAALKGEKSLEALTALLKDAIDRSDADTLTKADILALIPVEGIIAALDEDIVEKLINEVLLVVDDQDLVDFALSLPTDALNVEAISAFITGKLDPEAVVPDFSPVEKYFPDGFFDSPLPEDAYFMDYIKLDAVFAEINVADVVIVSKLTTSDYIKLAKLVGVRNLINILKDDAKALVSKEQLAAVIEVVMFNFINNMDLISVNGYDVAVEDEYGALSFNLKDTVKAIASTIPSLTEWAECEDGKILSFNLYAEYKNEDGKSFVKDINVEVVLKGDLTNFRKLASKLSEYIAIYNDGNVLYVDVTMPEIITRAFAKFLESDKGDSIKDEILGLGDMTGNELVAAIENLTLEKIIRLAQKVDVEDLYTYVMNITQVEMILEKIQATLGLNYKLEDIQDLNKILDEIADGLPRFTFEKVVNAISARVKIDIMKYLDKGTAFIDNHDLISKLEKIPYIGGYVAKYGDRIELNAILNQYKGVDPVEAVSDFVAKLVGGDLQEFLKTHTANEVYDRFVEEVAERALAHKDIFERVKSYVLAALDPDYVANSDWGKMVQTLIPDKIYNLLDNSIADAYVGNGKFEVGDHNIDIDLGVWSEKALDLLFKYVDVSDTLKSYIESFLPTSTVNFGLNFSLTMRGLSGVTFMDEAGKKDAVMFLPNGLNPAKYYNPGKDVSFWADKNANAVTEIRGDVTLYPVRGFITGGTLTIDKNGNWTITSENETFDIFINLAQASIYKLENAKTLTFANSKGLKITMDQATIAQMIREANGGLLKVSYGIDDLSKTEISSQKDGAFTYKPARVEMFNIAVAGVAFDKSFDSAVTVTVPFAGAISTTGVGRTNVYQIVEGKMSAEEFDVTVNKGKNVVFKTTHFSDYIVVNEYKYTTTFADNDGPLPAGENATKADGYIPVGATVKIRPELTNKLGAKIASVTYNGANAFNTTITMPASAVVIECTVEYPAGNTYYDVFGTLYTTEPSANNALDAWLADANNKLPAGYKIDATNRWIETSTDLANGDVYKSVNLVAIEYTVVFPGATPGQITFTVETLKGYAVPVVDATADGMIVVWTLSDNLNPYDPMSIIENYTGNTYVLTATKTEVANKYTIVNVNGEKVGECSYKDTYTYTATTAGNAVIYINLNTGLTIEATNGAITMPASDVMVLEIAMVTYTVNGQQFTAALGSIASYTVTLAKNQALKAQPNVGKLSSYVINADGSKTLTYTFEVKAGIAITYAIETVAVDSYDFFTYEGEEEKASLLWLWILIALIVLIGLIALFYNLYINEKLKPNFMLRFITWIVSMFFNACLAVSAAVLWIAQGTTKKGEVDYEEFGMTNPEDLENTEETAEETTEEITEETAADGDDAVEAIAEVETETVEETVEETAEEVAEEAVSDEAVVEEAVIEETATEEAVTEEVVAEEAVVEETVAEEVATEEAATEEVVVDETVAEETTDEQN